MLDGLELKWKFTGIFEVERLKILMNFLNYLLLKFRIFLIEQMVSIKVQGFNFYKSMLSIQKVIVFTVLLEIKCLLKCSKEILSRMTE